MAAFFLRTKRTEGIANLYTRVKKRNPYIKWEYVNTGIGVDIETWQKANRSIITWNKFIGGEGKELSSKLDRVSQTIDMLFAENKLQSNSDKTILENALALIANNEAIKAKEEIKERQKKEQERAKAENLRKQKQIVHFYECFVNGIVEGSIRYGKGSEYTKSSIQIWKTFGRYLKEFCPEDKTFDDVTRQFADNFRQFLEKKHFMEMTINKYVTCFRKLCNLAAVEGINNNAVSLKVWKERTVKGSEAKAEVYLTEHEIDSLYAMRLSGIEEAVRDVFFLGICSGQRVSDYASLNRSNFKITDRGTNIISLYQVKTGAYVEIPIVDERAFEICEKYNYKFPDVNKRDINRYIKVILKHLSDSVPSLKQDFPTTLTAIERRKEERYLSYQRRIESGEKLTGEDRHYYVKLKRIAEEQQGSPIFRRDENGRVVMAKYELIGTHTARRSALTNLYKTGLFDTREMMSISGHKSERVFEHYIRMTATEQADRIAEKLRKLKSGQL